MHELGITQEIIDIAAAKAAGALVRRIVIEIGKLSAVLPDAIRFCFEVCREGTALAEAELEILELPGRARCRVCAADVVLDRPFGRCAAAIPTSNGSAAKNSASRNGDLLMCTTCGCSDDRHAHLTDMQTGETVALRAPSGHEHRRGNTLRLEQEILGRNDDIARHNRDWLAGRGVLALNLVSSPGAGKTSLLERTLRDMSQEFPIAVIEGDQETDRDARRIQQAGGRAIQINTGTACHLDASMIALALPRLAPEPGSVVLIENVGNLVCPALFDLGEFAKVLVMSVTEGDDKPLKYPHMFRASGLLLLNKIDLLPYVTFDVARFLDNVRQVHAGIEVLHVSAARGDGMVEWYQWLRDRCNLPAGSRLN